MTGYINTNDFAASVIRAAYDPLLAARQTTQVAHMNPTYKIQADTQWDSWSGPEPVIRAA
jgi:hypothetical protein